MTHIPGLIWGSLILLFGASLIIQALTGISIPIFRIFSGIMLIYLGYSIIFKEKDYKIKFKSMSYKVENFFTQTNSSYATFCSSTEIDLSHYRFLENTEYTFTSNTIFGSTIITIPKNVTVQITIDSFCSDIKLPEDKKIQSGKKYIMYKSDIDNAPILHLYIQSSFGSVLIQ